jgi:hypothetical protein
MAMEACCGAHHLGRSLVAVGHQVKLVSPVYIRPYDPAAVTVAQMAELTALTIKGLDLGRDKVVRWRCIDFCDEATRRFNVTATERTIGKWLPSLS